MPVADVAAIIHGDPAPTLLVRTNGDVLAVNPAARQDLGMREGDNLLGHVVGSPERVAAYLRICWTTREPVPAKLRFLSQSQDFRCLGGLVEPATESRAALLILRLQPVVPAQDKFNALTARIAELNAEIRRRQQAEEQLRTLLADKEVLLQELDHRIKNNLQTIASLLSLAAARETEERARLSLMDAVSRIHAMVAIQRLLHRARASRVIGAQDLLAGVCESIHHAYSRTGVEIALDVAPLAIAYDQVVPLGLIVNEALTNAYKYAFPGDRTGCIQVLFQPEPTGKLQLCVADDGCGFDVVAHKTGLGLMLIPRLAQQLDGEVHIESSKGTQIRVRFRPSGDRGRGGEGVQIGEAEAI